MFSQTVEFRGHILDSLLLSKVLDEVVAQGGSFQILRLEVGQRGADPSYARLRILAHKRSELAQILLHLRDQGAEVVTEDPAAP